MTDHKQKHGTKDEKHGTMNDGDTKKNDDASMEKPKPSRLT